MFCRKKVPLAGTVEPDKFVITKNGHSVLVQQYKLGKNKDKNELVFEKTYHDSKQKSFGFMDWKMMMCMKWQETGA